MNNHITLSSALGLFHSKYMVSKADSYQAFARGRLGFDEESARENSLLGSLGDIPLSEVTADCIQEWANSLATQRERWADSDNRPTSKGGLSPQTIDGYRRMWSTFWKWLVKQGYAADDFTGLIEWKRALPLGDIPPKAISDTAAHLLLEHAGSHRDYALVRFLLFTGARVGEVASLTLERLSIDDRHANVHGKGGKKRPVIFDRETADALQEYIRNHRPLVNFDEVFVAEPIHSEYSPLTTGGIQQVLGRIKERAGIDEPVSPHRLRHWFATSTLANGGNLGFVQDQLGHSDPAMTRRYSRFSTKMLKKQYDVVYGDGEEDEGQSPKVRIVSARRKTPDDYRCLAQERGIEWLGPEVTATRHKTWWRCRYGHEWETTYEIIRRGHGCSECAGNGRKSAQDYFDLAQERGFRWLGPAVPTAKAKTTWECEEGHQWEARYSSVRSGDGCPTCANNTRKTPEDYRLLAEALGLYWIGPEVSNAHESTNWVCSVCNHRWESRYDYLQKNGGCPLCVSDWLKSAADYRTLAEKRGFEWLGPMVTRVADLTRWQCAKGHMWEANYHSVYYIGSGCPECTETERLRQKCKKYHELAEKHGLEWTGPEVRVVRSKTGWRCPEGHEWQAAYRSIKSGAGCPECKGRVPKAESDYHELAEKWGRRWLGPMVPRVDDLTNWECLRCGNVQEASFRYVGRYNCRCHTKKIAADYHELADKKGLEWLGPMPDNIKTDTWWRCRKGHEWQAFYGNVSRGTGCPRCARRRFGPEKYHKLAAKKGFEWLGPEVKTVHSKTRWKCLGRHEFKSTYNHIKHGKRCPQCVKASRNGRKETVDG